MQQGSQDTFSDIISNLVMFSIVVIMIGYALIYIVPMAIAFVGVGVLIYTLIGLALYLDTKPFSVVVPTAKIRNTSFSIALIVLYIALTKLEQDSSSQSFYQQVFVIIGIIAAFPVIFLVIKQHFTNPVSVSTPPPSGSTHSATGGGISSSGNTQQNSQSASRSSNNLFGSTPTQNPVANLDRVTGGISSKLENELAAYTKTRISIGLYPALQQATFDGLKTQWDKKQEAFVPDRIKDLYDKVSQHHKELDNIMTKTGMLSTLLGQLEQDSVDPEITDFVTGVANYLEEDFKSVLDEEKWNEANQVIDEFTDVAEKVFQDSQNNLGGASTKTISYEDACTVLDIAPDSDLKQAKTAYRKLVQIYHPDKITGDRDKFETIAEAFGVVEAKHKRN